MQKIDKKVLKKMCCLVLPALLAMNLSRAQQNITWKDLSVKASNMESMVYKTTEDTSLKIYYL